MEEKNLVSGIYRVFDADSGESFIGFSYNVFGTMKRLRFELTLNACSYKLLQDFWNTCGGLSMELIEEYSCDGDISDVESDSHLKAKLFAAKERLGKDSKFIQIEV